MVTLNVTCFVKLKKEKDMIGRKQVTNWKNVLTVWVLGMAVKRH